MNNEKYESPIMPLLPKIAESMGMKYHIEIDEDRAKRKLDTSWHEIHTFGKGWSWRRFSDGFEIHLDYFIKNKMKFEEWPTLHIVLQNAIIFDLKLKREEERIRIAALPPYVPPKFDLEESIANFPVILDLIPQYRLNDLFSNKPKPATGPGSDKNYKEAKIWRLKYLKAFRRSDRWKEGSRKWLQYRKEAVKFRSKIQALGTDVCVPKDYELKVK